ncbi:MAG TPA: polyprenyl synthetase family protein [Chloroflexia bacterium]|nr:polyprenyl synthetase family protein [Chloroflexia bacterium]
MVATAPASAPAVPSLKALLTPIRAEMEAVETKLRATDDEEFPLLHLALDRVFGSGGKRLRPALAILAAQAGPAPVETRRMVALGAAMETLHTASLVHDDLIDNSYVRRGLPTLNAWMSPAATVLAGDYLFARAAVLITETDHVGVIARFADSLRQLCDGELRQMFRNAFASIPGLAVSLGLEFNANGPAPLVPGSPAVADDLAMLPTDAEYERRITGKTAALFATAAQTGAMLAGFAPERAEALYRYGLSLGRAFQIVDDVLDFTSTEAELGKPVGSDLRQGHLTLPVIRFAQADPQEWHDWITRIPQLIKGGDFIFGEAPAGSGKRSATPEQEQALRELIARIAQSTGVRLALQRAAEYAQQAQAALADLPASAARTLLNNLAQYVVERSY